jgi:uncharacterized protein YegL
MERRLPVYLLIDCSESMAGPAYEAMKNGLSQLIAELRTNPMALETSAVSLITFSNTAKQQVPLTDLLKFNLPSLLMGSGTAFGQGLELLEKCMSTEVTKTTATQKGDYKPVVFILTDGVPTDKWEQAADRIKANISGKKANIIAVACGPYADTAILRRVTDTVLEMKDASPGAFKAFFQWVSASVSVASQRVDSANETAINLPNIPQEHLEVANQETEKHSKNEKVDADHLAFLHIRCNRTKKDFVGRYEKVGSTGGGFFSKAKPKYQLIGSFEVPGWESGEGATGKMSTESFDDVPACPHCPNDWIAGCQCGGLQCAPAMHQGPISLTCPWCGNTGQYGQGGNFEVNKGAG